MLLRLQQLKSSTSVLSVSAFIYKYNSLDRWMKQVNQKIPLYLSRYLTVLVKHKTIGFFSCVLHWHSGTGPCHGFAHVKWNCAYGLCVVHRCVHTKLVLSCHVFKCTLPCSVHLKTSEHNYCIHQCATPSHVGVLLCQHGTLHLGKTITTNKLD